MSSFNFAAAIAKRPSFAERGAVYGNYRYAERGGGWVTPDVNWERFNLVRIDVAKDLPGFPKLYGTIPVKYVTMHRIVAPIFIASWAVLYKRGLHVHLKTFDGCYAPRHMQNNPRMPLSNHSTATAIDFNAQTNMLGIPHARMQMNREVVAVMEGLGWAWGGRWSVSDGMHFEWVDQDPKVAPAHQDKLALFEIATLQPKPKVSPNPRAEDTQSLKVGKLILNGMTYDIAKATVVRDTLYVNTPDMEVGKK